MRLSAIPIINWNNINNFCTANQWTIRNGEQNTLYFQLVDLDQSPCCKNGCPSRYVAGVGVPNQPASIIVTFPSIDCTQAIQITATQDTSDGSIWSVNLSSSQNPFGGSVQFSLTQGTTVRSFSVLNMLGVEYPNCEGSDGSLADSGTFSFNPPFGE